MKRPMVILILLVAGLLFYGAFVQAQTQPKELKMSLYLGGAYLTPKVEYNYEWSDRYLGETMSLASSLTSANPFGGTFGAGLSFMDTFEIYASYSFFKKTLAGDVSFTLPSYIYWDEIASTTGIIDLEYKENIIDIGIAYHLPLENVAPYFGAGISLVSAKIETPTTLTFTDRHEGEWYYYYWYYRFDFEEHLVDIESVDVTEESLSTTGFHFKAGIDFSVTPNVGFFLEGKYIAAKIKLPIRIDARSSGTDYIGGYEYSDDREFLADGAEDFEIDFGGLSVVIGINISFQGR